MISEKIRSAREAKGITRVQLAEKSGVGLSTIADAERNRHKPHLGNVLKLAAALEVDPWELLREERSE